MELSSEDALRLNVMLANRPLAIRIHESSMTLYGLLETGEASIRLNPVANPDRYLLAVRSFLSEKALGNPGGYPLYLQRWTRQGQMREQSLEQLLMLGDPTAVFAVVCAEGIGPEIARRAWSRSARLCLWLPAPKAAALVALCAATLYAGLAGFSLPTQRALCMLALALGGLLLNRGPALGRTLALALLLVTLGAPAAVLSAGFWLSFGAVAAILYGVLGRLARPRPLAGLARVQGYVALAIAPLLLLWGLEVSLLAPLVNLVAVPLFSLLLVPLSLLAVALLLLC
ncbi:MAG: hypothetical protein B0D86_00095, partial [Candidatus Sedimenticola endophacoides]